VWCFCLAAQRFAGERFNLRKLNELEVRQQYQIEITNRFATLENLSDDEDINRAWKNIKENNGKGYIVKTQQHMFSGCYITEHKKTTCFGLWRPSSGFPSSNA
jgi:hypothetical protein